MKYFSEITKIIENGIKGDTEKVYNYSVMLSKKLEKDNDKLRYDRLQKILLKYNSQSNENDSIKKIESSNMKQIPFDQESKLEIADFMLPSQIDDKNIFLSDIQEKQVNDFILGYENIDKLAIHNIEISYSMLLYGPPGCGKTETALKIAKRLQLPIVIARLDTLISSYLGSTSKNIRLLFKYIENTPSILFLDEFDAIAKQRDDIHELGELKRVVNSLLQNIDSLNSNNIIIAATNHEKLLDEAIWRRFSTRINIKKPNEELIYKYLMHKFEEFHINLDIKLIEFLSVLFEGESFADIDNIIKAVIRNSIINSIKIQLSDFVNEYFNYTNFVSKLTGELDKDREIKVRLLLSKKTDISDRLLGQILKCHHNTIKKYRNKIEKENELNE
ncbi:AAA family ATPase [Clostridium hydrogenum]|uniref:AAA family ATPase n=1 Tax=Clostridium hydrogenum TaxID=2855764 RepID=UPI001F162DE6|nr:ATP-binding protein [Clostridium hydrogenum]